MEPGFSEFDRVITYNWGKIEKGSVIVFKDKGTIFIKRVDKIIKGQIFVSGDNKKQSSKLGPIGYRDLIGRVFLKY